MKLPVPWQDPIAENAISIQNAEKVSIAKTGRNALNKNTCMLYSVYENILVWRVSPYFQQLLDHEKLIDHFIG